MKTVKKEVVMQLKEMEVRPICNYILNEPNHAEFKYTFSTCKHIENIETIRFYVEVEEPETLKEWLDKTGIPKKELLEWLKNNFKN